MGLGAGVAGASAASAEAAGADATRVGMDLFREAAGNLSNVGVEFKKGNLFEYIEASRFNARAAEQGAGLRARVTAAHGDPTGPVDLVIEKAGRVVKQVQAKVSQSSTWMAREHADPKYLGQDRLVPSDKAVRVQDLSDRLAERAEKRGRPDAAAWRDASENIQGELNAGDVSSGGTTVGETYRAAANAERFARLEELHAVGREAAVAGTQAAAAGLVMGGAISAVKNGLRVARGEQELGTAIQSVAKDAGRAGFKGGAVGAGGAVVRHVGGKVGVAALTKSNVATAVAASMIDAGTTVYAFAKGELSAEETAVRLGENGCSTISGIYVGAAAGAIFGPAGAVVGSMAGYLIAATVYQSCVAVHREARLAEEEAARIEALCAEAVRVLDAGRAEFIQRLNATLQERDRAVDACFTRIESGLASAQPESAIEGLTALTALCGARLQFACFAEFDAFMVETDGPLRL